MQLGVVLPDEAEADPRRIVEVARRAEALGFSGVWLPDHLLPPSDYGPVYGGVFEPLTLLSHIAAVTTRITLGTSEC
jgi:alkanesulfonate monooxygenase SsuD/methylene tetrahydromethanopterin reductase-like flavin-dependent oxidoreductase (luciferase family)